MLTIDLRRLAEAPVVLEGEIASDDSLWDKTGVQLASALRVEATADGSRTRGVLVRGSFAGRARARCRRCLKGLEFEVGERFDLLFEPGMSELDSDLSVYTLDPQADELDLRATIRERLLLAIPGYPVCREDCRGLCAGCGADLNDGTCSCPPKEADPRWGPLRGLKGKLQFRGSQRHGSSEEEDIEGAEAQAPHAQQS